MEKRAATRDSRHRRTPLHNAAGCATLRATMEQAPPRKDEPREIPPELSLGDIPVWDLVVNFALGLLFCVGLAFFWVGVAAGMLVFFLLLLWRAIRERRRKLEERLREELAAGQGAGTSP